MVLGLLVLSILSFTAFFREGDGGFLHDVKGVVTSVVSPVQDVAVAAVRPLRDGWNWFADLRGARDERDQLRAENQRLRDELASNQVAAEKVDVFAKQIKVINERPDGYAAVTANIIQRPAIEVSRRARIDRGKDAGVTVNSLVFMPRTTPEPDRFGALVGRVERVDAHSSEVTFITDPSSSIAASILLSGSKLGLLRANSSGNLILSGLPGSVRVEINDIVVTLGAGTDRLMSPYPPGIAIGYVSSVGSAEPGATQSVQVTPYADPTTLETLVVFVPRSSAAKRRAGIG